MKVNIISVKPDNIFIGTADIKFSCPEAGIDEKRPEKVHIYSFEELGEAIAARIRLIIRARNKLETLKLFEGKEIDIEL